MVSDYAKMFADKPLNGNPGMWEWGVASVLGRRAAKKVPDFEKK